MGARRSLLSRRDGGVPLVPLLTPFVTFRHIRATSRAYDAPMRALAIVCLLTLPLSAQILPETVVLKLPGMEKAEVRKDIGYDGDRKLDLYRPVGATGALPVVVFLNGVARPDLKEWGQYTSWPRLVAAKGMAAVTHQTSGDDVPRQIDALLAYLRSHAGELKIDPARIAIWGCSANVRAGTALLAKSDFRAAVFYYGLMETAPKNIDTPVLVTRAGLDAPNLNQSIDRWVSQAVALDAPVTLVTYPEGRHGFDVLDDTPQTKKIVEDTLDFLQFHLTTPRTPRKEPMTLAQLNALFAESTDRAMTRLRELQKTHPNAFVLQESALNSFGYSLLGENKTAEAVRVLELVVALHPESANAHDSLGDAYEAAGRKADAIRESERALALLEKAPEPRREGIRRSAEEKLKRLK
jgi:dienelactone hydrolase